MKRSLIRGALLMGAALSLLALEVAAQADDVFAPFRTAPPALSELFAGVPPQPAADLSEAVSVVAARRVALGGEPRAHLLLSLEEPLTAALRRELDEQGIRILDKVDAATWIASVDQAGADFIERGGPIRGATLMPPQAKLSDAISLDQPFGWQRREGEEGLGYSVLFHKGVSADEAVEALRSVAEVNVEAVDPATFPYVRSLTVALTRDELVDVAALDVVQFVEPEEPPLITDNQANTQPLSNVNVVQGPPYNLSGVGVTVGIWESGATVRPTHQELTPRVTVASGETTTQTAHALHVAGTIASSGVSSPGTEGMARAANLISWDSANDAAEMAAASQPGAANRIVASNHSYGSLIGWNDAVTAFTNNQASFGAYNNTSVAWDTIVAGDGVSVAGTELVVMKSAGNHRNDGPGTALQPADCRQGGLGVDADCLDPRGVAKNVITVGAMNGGAAIAGFSGFGPTDDGRIKPDLMANGTNVLSLGNNSGAPQDDTSAYTTQGTSMAAPAVTGIVALLREQLTQLGITEISAAAIKAILIQTARDVAGIGQAGVGPDYAAGWGIVDAQAAADLLRRPGGPGYAEGTVTASGASGAWEFPFVVPAGQPELHVTLAWSDLPGTPAGAGSELVNDLDLRLIPPGGGAAQMPWTLNPANPAQAAVQNGGDDATNNVEQVSVLTPAPGTWLARVTAKAGSLALGPQLFAIAGPITPFMPAVDTPLTSWKDGSYQHVAYLGRDEHVHELYFEIGVGPWKHADLNNSVGPAAPLAAPNSALTSWWDGNYQHVAYLDPNGRVQELYYEFGVGPWKHADLHTEVAAAGPAAPLAAPKSALTSWRVGAYQQVAYVGTSADWHVQELSFEIGGGPWKHTDLHTAAAGPGVTRAVSHALTSCSDGAYQHVAYLDPIGRVHELYFEIGVGPWKHTDLHTAAGPAAPLAAPNSALTSWWDGAYQHVAYLDPNGRVQELSYEFGVGPWKHTDLHTAAGPAAPLAAPNSALTSWWDGAYQHIAYLDPNRRVQELSYEFGVGPWKHTDLHTEVAAAGPAAPVAPLAAPNSALTGWWDGTRQHVAYVGGDAYVHELYFEFGVGPWKHTDLTAAATP